jgi:hypothetical protein
MIDSAWRKSSASNSNSNCVEVRGQGDAVDVRDSKNPDGPVLSFGQGGVGHVRGRDQARRF